MRITANARDQLFRSFERLAEYHGISLDTIAKLARIAAKEKK